MAVKQSLNKPLSRLLLWQKFAILGMIVVILVSIPLFLFISGELDRIDVTVQEKAGLKSAQDVVRAMQGIQKLRGLAAAYPAAASEAVETERRKQKAAVEQATAALEVTARQLNYPRFVDSVGRFKENWGKLMQAVDTRSLTPDLGYERYTKLADEAVELMKIILAGSTMDLDPYSETYYVIQATLVTAPDLAESLGQSLGYGAGALNRGDRGITQQDRLILANLLESTRENVGRTRFHVESFHRAAPAMMDRLDPELASVSQSVDMAMQLTSTEILDAKALNFPAADYFNGYSGALDAVYGFIDRGFATIYEEFDQQIAKGRTTLAVLTALVLAIFAIGTLVAFAITRSITGPVGTLVDVMHRLAAGDRTARANLDREDELGLLARQFDSMIEQRESVSATMQQENEQLNNSIIELLQAVAKLSQRDLTTKIPVAEDITGPVADALNLLSEETAKVLNRVVSIAGEVASISQQVKSQSDTVIQVASDEKREVEQAAAELSEASEAMLDIAKLAHSCNEAAEKAIQTTDKAQETVLGTVQGITTIRDTIRETEKRIKRLGERSQEIGGVVNLINSIAEHTHILALNASMHAASAGEAGRGFAVVANEVQRLAENAREATSKIAALVNNIQVETADTVTTMNDAISQVVRGTDLAQRAGNEMRETRNTTSDLVQLVQRIAESSTAQAQTTQQLRERAMQIRKSTEQTYEQLQEQGQQTERLVGFSGDLVESVDVFVLPNSRESIKSDTVRFLKVGEQRAAA